MKWIVSLYLYVVPEGGEPAGVKPEAVAAAASRDTAKKATAPVDIECEPWFLILDENTKKQVLAAQKEAKESKAKLTKGFIVMEAG